MNLNKKVLITALVPVVLIAAFVAYKRTPAAHSRSTASAMIERATANPWSGNERAIPKLQEMLKADPSSPEWNTTLGHAYLQKARETGDPAYYSKAEQLFDRALASKHEYPEALMGQASLAMSRHEFQKAREIAQHAIQINPDVASTYGILTDALVELGEYGVAIQTLDKMVRMKPNLSSYSRISYVRELHGDIDGAIQAMQMATDSGAPDGENTAWCMVQLGNLYLNSGRLGDADREYRTALKRFPNYVHAFAGMAKVAVAQKDFSTAVRFYQKAIDGVPLPEFLIGLGEAYDRMGRTEEARQQFDLVRAIQQIYRSNGVNMDLEMVLFNADHGSDIDHTVDLAHQEWERRKSVKVADAYAWALYRAGRLPEAQEMMKQAMRLGSRDPLFLRHASEITTKAQNSAAKKTQDGI